MPLGLLLGYPEPEDAPLAAFHHVDGDVIVMDIHDSTFTTTRSRLNASMSPMSTSSLGCTDSLRTSAHSTFGGTVDMVEAAPARYLAIAEKCQPVIAARSTSYFLDLFWRACSILFAFSSSRLREAGRPLPPRFRKYCIIRMPESIPFGLTFLEAICRAIVPASLVNMPFSGKVDTVETLLTHRLLPFLGIP